MKILWTGTDSLMLIDVSKRDWIKRPYWYLFRIFAIFLDIFTQEHYCDSENIADNLKLFGMRKPISVKPDFLKHLVKYTKVKHDGFNVLYYFPNTGMELNFRKWLYGYDVFEQVKQFFPEINFIVVDGTQDMSKVYPVIDYYLRPNRHDGASRLIQECEIQEIKYYHSYKDPNLFEIIYNLRWLIANTNGHKTNT